MCPVDGMRRKQLGQRGEQEQKEREGVKREVEDMLSLRDSGVPCRVLDKQFRVNFTGAEAPAETLGPSFLSDWQLTYLPTASAAPLIR